MDQMLQALYQSTDYRAFLREYFQEQKRARKAFSHRYFARLAGFESSGFLAHVMAGERNLTETSIRKICKAMGFKGTGPPTWKPWSISTRRKPRKKKSVDGRFWKESGRSPLSGKWTRSRRPNISEAGTPRLCANWPSMRSGKAISEGWEPC